MARCNFPVCKGLGATAYKSFQDGECHTLYINHGIEKKYVRNSLKGVRTLITFVLFTCDFFFPCQLNEFSFCAPREEPMFQQRPYLILCFGTKSSVLLAFNECLLIVPCLWEALGSMWSLHVLCTCKITGWICSIYNSRLAHGGFHLDRLSLFDQHKVWTLTLLAMSPYTSVFWCLGKGPESLKQTPKYEGLLSSCQRQIPPARASCDTVHTGQRALTSKEHRFKRKQMKLGTMTHSWRRAALPSTLLGQMFTSSEGMGWTLTSSKESDVILVHTKHFMSKVWKSQNYHSLLFNPSFPHAGCIYYYIS